MVYLYLHKYIYICGTSGNLRDFASPLYASVNQDMQAAAQWWFQVRMAALGRPKDWSQQDQIGLKNKIKAETKKSGRAFMHDKTGSKEDFSKSCLLFHLGNTPEWEKSCVKLCEGVDRKDSSGQRPVVPEIWEARWGLNGCSCAVVSPEIWSQHRRRWFYLKDLKMMLWLRGLSYN